MRDRRHFIALMLILIGAVCASALMFWIMRLGAGLTPDSFAYIGVARSLHEGKGFFVGPTPLTHFPPFYPILLAVIGLVSHGDMVMSARALAAILFGVNAALIAGAVYISTGRSLPGALCAMCFFLTSTQILFIHARAWSEAPFMALALASLISISIHVSRPRPAWLAGAALLAGLAVVTRYVGMTVLPPAVLCLLAFGDRPFGRRMKDALIFVCIACAPMLLWIARNLFMAENATNRSFAVHPFGREQAVELLTTFYQFIWPVVISFRAMALQLGMVILACAGIIFVLIRGRYGRLSPAVLSLVLPATCAMFACAYLAFLIVSISFFDAGTPLSPRIVFPEFLTLLIAGISLAWHFTRAMNKTVVWHGFLALMIVCIALNARGAAKAAAEIHRNGNGYNAPAWLNSEILAFVAKLDDSRKIYCNGGDALLFFTGRESAGLPLRYHGGTMEVNGRLREQIQQMSDECSQGKALVVYLNGFIWRDYLPSLQEIEAPRKLPVYRKFSDGVIFGTAQQGG